MGNAKSNIPIKTKFFNLMKNSTKFLALTGALAVGFGASAQLAFEKQDVPFRTTHRTTPVMADFNNDGRLDILYGGQGDNSFNDAGCWWQINAVLGWNNGDGAWDVDAVTASKNEEPNKDEDGNIILGEDGQPVYGWSLNAPKHGLLVSCWNNYAPIDYNNDGLVDVLIYGKMDWDIMVPEDQRGPHLVLYRNNGDGTFTREEKAVFPKGNPDNNGVNYAIAVADYDRDGYVDFFVSGNLDDSAKESEVHPGRMAFLYKNIDGTGEFKRMDIASTKGGVYTKEIKDEESGEVVVEKQELPGWFLPVSGNVHFADLNNDGWVDLVIDGWVDECWDPAHIQAGNYGRIYMNRNGEKFEDVTPEEASFYTLRSSGSTLADFDGDGYLDYFLTGWGDNGYDWNAFLYTNTTEETCLYDFPSECNDLGVMGTEACRPYVTDMDGDGNLDIVYTGRNEYTSIYMGSMSGSFTALEVPEVTPLRDSWGVVGDVTGNGLGDIFLTGYKEGAEFGLYYNKTDVKVEAPAMPTNVIAEYSDGKLNISWDAADGADAYNVYVKNGDNIYCVLPADIETGFIKVMNRMAALRPDQTSYSVAVPEGSYTVGVQSVSQRNFTYSKFATAALGGIDSAMADKAAAFSVKVDSEGVMVEGNGEAVKVVNALGQTVATGVAGQHINVAANGVLIVVKGNETAKVVK